MIDKTQLFLYEYIKLCNEYYNKKDKALLSQIHEMYARDLDTRNFVFNAFPKNTRCYSGRINTQSSEDISRLEEGDTFKFSDLNKPKIRVWCKDKEKLKKHIEHKIFGGIGTKAVIVTELINKDHVLFDYDTYNTLIDSGQLNECFTGTLRESAKEFKKLNVDDTIKEVLVSSNINRGEVLEVINRFNDFDNKKLVDEIKKSLSY
jgi:hypothetical protein